MSWMHAPVIPNPRRTRHLLAIGLAALSFAAVGCVEEDDPQATLEGQRTAEAGVVTEGPGSLKWSKEDEHWDLLGGATFEVCRTHDWVSGGLVERSEPYCFEVTDNDALDEDSRDGVFLVDGLALGKYEIRETTAPPGYEPSEETHEVVLTPTAPDDPEAEAFMNNPLLGSLRWSKEDEHWDLLGGATFEVCRTHDWDWMESMLVERETPRCFEVTDNDALDEDPRDGVIVVDDVALGKYAIRETAAPPGYVPSDETHYVILTPTAPDDPEAEAFMNEPLLGSLRWSKEDEHWDLLGGATFEVCRTHDWDWMESELVERVEPDCFEVTDNDARDSDDREGVIVIEGVVLGKYAIRETAAPPGYVPSDETHYVILTPTAPDDPEAEAFMNEPLLGSLRWSKEDQDWNLLGGATFEVCRTHDWDWMESMLVERVEPDCFSITDNDATDDDAREGVIVVEDVVLGKYAIRETMPPPGYVGTDEIHYVVLSPSYPDDPEAEAFMNYLREQSGCTLGFFKNHEYLWDQPTDPLAMAAGFTTSTDFHTFFGLTPAQSGLPAGITMHDALGLGGGGRFNLARQGVAALLNVASGFAYGWGNDAGALRTAIRNQYLTCAGQGFANGCYTLAGTLDGYNNFGCLIDPQPHLKPKPNGGRRR